MTKNGKQSFWRNYGLSIFLVAVIIIAVILIRMKPSADVPKTEDNTVSVKAEAAGNPVTSSVSREVLSQDAIIALTNNARSQNGLPPLKENQLLNKIAESRAQDMLDKQYFAHVSPTGQQASDVAQEVGYHYKIIAENIGSGDFYTNQKIIDGWMQSPGHRKNILSTEVEDIGAAVLKGKFKGEDTYITVQIFGLPSLPVAQNICVAPSDNLLHDIEVKKAEMESLKDQLNRLKNELNEEKDSIETDRKNINNDAQKIQQLNVRINAFNEKSNWYSRVMEDAKAKSAVAASMIDEYNKMVQTYNDCKGSH